MRLWARRGTVTFLDQSSIAYSITFSRLMPINDTVAVSNYTFTAPGPITPATAQGYEVDLLNGPTVLGFQTATISSPATPPNFELVNYANKTNVTVDMTGISLPGNNVDATFLYDNSDQATGQSTLTGLLGAGNDTATVEATPNGVASSINTGSGNDLLTVVGTSLATGIPISSLSVDGGTGVNTLHVDAQGTTATLSTPGTVAFGGIGGPSFAYSDFSNLEVVETNHVAGDRRVAVDHDCQEHPHRECRRRHIHRYRLDRERNFLHRFEDLSTAQEVWEDCEIAQTGEKG